MPHLFLPVLRACRRWGAVHVATGDDGTPAGIACWLAPGNADLALWQWLSCGLLNVYWRIGPRAMRRFAVKEAFFERHHRADMPAAHWYLLLLGVEPDRQGQGVGGALLSPTLARADAEGCPCYLETDSERNLRFYARHGFTVAREGVIGKDGPRVWTLRRAPSPAYSTGTPPVPRGTTST
jgi:GNAT superfamily N-acetyltransferase